VAAIPFFAVAPLLLWTGLTISPITLLAFVLLIGRFLILSTTWPGLKLLLQNAKQPLQELLRGRLLRQVCQLLVVWEMPLHEERQQLRRILQRALVFGGEAHQLRQQLLRQLLLLSLKVHLSRPAATPCWRIRALIVIATSAVTAVARIVNRLR